MRRVEEVGAARESNAPSLEVFHRSWTLDSVAWWMFAFIFGAINLWRFRFSITDVDGVCYLDLGDAYLRGDWSTAINGYWSPLYGILQAIVLKIVRPGAFWEYPCTQIANLLFYVLSIAAFEFMLRQLEAFRQARADQTSLQLLPNWAIRCIAWPLFIWSALYWQYLWLLSPDVMLSAIIFTLAGLVLRAARGDGRWRIFVAMGVMLGLGYLTKGAMAPLAFVFVGTTWLAAPRGQRRTTALRGFVALLIFAAISAPLVIALSLQKGRFTTGETGRLNYAWYVTGATQDWPHWQGQPPRTGKPLHPSRKLSDDPTIYEYATPVGGSYPIWYDPTYWHEGIRAPIKWGYIKPRLKRSAEYYLRFVTTETQTCLWIATAIVLGAGGVAMRKHLWRGIGSLALNWPLALPALAAMALYSLVHLRERYIGPFAILVWIALFAAVRVKSGLGARLAREACVVVGVGLALFSGALTFLENHWSWDHSSLCNSVFNWKIAESLSSHGLREGHRVGIIGDSLGSARWARLARVRVVVEIPYWDMKRFLAQAPAKRVETLQLMKTSGARAIVLGGKPPTNPEVRWDPLGDTGYFVHYFTD